MDYYSRAVGIYGIRPADFWRLTIDEYAVIQNGFYEHQSELQRTEWERIRWQTFVMLQPHVKPNSLKRPTDLIKFSWEKSQTPDIKKLIESGAMDIFPKTL